jgi:hypothetical protein
MTKGKLTSSTIINNKNDRTNSPLNFLKIHINSNEMSDLSESLKYNLKHSDRSRMQIIFPDINTNTQKNNNNNSNKNNNNDNNKNNNFYPTMHTVTAFNKHFQMNKNSNSLILKKDDSAGAAIYLVVVILWYILGVVLFVACQMKRRKPNDYKIAKVSKSIGAQDKKKILLGRILLILY